MTLPLRDIGTAHVPVAGLARLADWRARADVRVAVQAGWAWVCWGTPDDALAARLLALPGAELYVQRDRRWYRVGRRIPSAGPPDDAELLPLHRVIVPEPLVAEPPPDAAFEPVPLRLVRDDSPRPTAAHRCRLADLVPWADVATTAELAAVRAARVDDQVLLLGDRLPSLRGERFWGGRVLTPLGWRPEPDLPEEALVRVLGLDDADLAVLDAAGAEAVPAAAFQPLTRASIRIALEEEDQ